MKLNAIRRALEDRLFSLWKHADKEGSAKRVSPQCALPELMPPGQPRMPLPDRLVLRWHTAFGQVFAEEKNGLSRRVGAFVLTVLAPAQSPPDEALELAATLEALFQRVVLPLDEVYLDGVYRLVCAEPYTSDAGLSAEKRAVITVTIPWHILF